MTGQAVNEVDAFVLGFGQWMHGTDGALQLAVLEAEAEMREAEFKALEIVLSHADDGELRWPDDLDALRTCCRAATTLGWLGSDGAEVEDIPDPPVEPGADHVEEDRLPPLLGHWLDPDATSIDAHNLAATIVHAEAEFREAEWEALAVVLDHVEDGALRWPVEAKNRVDLFEALQALYWVPGGGATG